MYGFAYSHKDILNLKKNNLKIIEDFIEAIGSKYGNKYVGSISDVSDYLVLYGNKTITTGEGGMIVTRNKDTYKKIVFLKSQGLDIYKTDNFYNHEMIGYNYRMTNICASIGLAQLNRINSFIKQKKLIF